MHTYTTETSPVGQPDPGRGWARYAARLAAWATAVIVIRADVRGGYYARSDGVVRPTTRTGGLTPGLIRRHWRPRGIEDVAGVHVTGVDETCRLVVVDAHEGDGADPERNRRFAKHVLRRARGLGAAAFLLDSNGAGGYHVWVLLPGPVPAESAWRLGRWLVDDFAAYGLSRRPESFPKAPRLTGKRIGNWVRLPGMHPKRECWVRVWGGQSRAWLEGGDAARALLATVPGDLDPTLAVPADFAPSPPRKTAPRRGRIGTVAGDAPSPSPRDVALARRALNFLGAEHRDDYDSWLRIGMTLRQLGDAGLELCHEWSEPSQKYESQVLDEKWQGFAADEGKTGLITLGTLFHEARENGWAGPWRRRGPVTLSFEVAIKEDPV